MFYIASRNIWINIHLVSEIEKREGKPGEYRYWVTMNNENMYELTESEATMLKNIMS